MKQGWITLLLLLPVAVVLSQENSIEELNKALQASTDQREKAALQYELAQAMLRSDPEEAIDIGKTAYSSAVDLNDESLAAQTAYLLALAYERERRDNYVETWLKSTLNYAKRVGDVDLIMKSVDKRSKLATKKGNYRRAYTINQEAFNYFTQNGQSISELRNQYEREKRQLERQRRELEQLRKELTDEVEILREEQELLDEENRKLSNVARRRTVQLEEKEGEIDSIAQQKAQVEEMVQAKEQEVKQLTRQALERKAAEEEVKRQLAEQEQVELQLKLMAQQNEERANYAIIAAGGLILLALLLYGRFRAKRRAADVLSRKNSVIEEERLRSDNLLLNILPATIAEELKTNGKAKARQFSETTVLFSDFMNFTSIAERLSPEELVEELDRCFKAFDDIISKYEDIEKIKTIGDAYMCAAGLNSRKTNPHNLVRAALEMQQWLDQERERRMLIGKPYFEARIGLHTGPVVAGVVGSKKFAYDIWGDTVNTASRIESNGQPGRVNISEATYNKIMYHFDCEPRGHVQAKNKGLIKMYFVNREKRSTAAYV